MSRQARIWLLTAVAAFSPATLPAADIESFPQQTPPPQTTPQAAPAAGSPFAPPDATCLEWTDSCRICQQPPTGAVACSNVGVACVPQPPRCTRR